MKYIETELLELKEKFNDSVVKEIESFLNTEGGSIIIGVSDSGVPIGVDNIDDTLRKISDVISDQIEPSAIDCVKPEIIYENNKILIKINVFKGKHNLYCIKKYGFSSNGCHIRVGSTCKSLSTEMIKIRQRNDLLITDIMLETPTHFGNISFKIFKIMLTERGYHIDDSSFEQNFKLKTFSNRYNLLAELISDHNSIPLAFVKFNGLDKTSVSERSEYGFESILMALDKIKTRLSGENRCFVNTTVRPRIETFLFDADSVKEAVLNAIVHNDYSISSPQISLFQDRLEILSHGGLPNGLSKEDFYTGISKPRNNELMNIFLRLGLVERTGHGIPLIVSKYGKEAFDIHDNYIKVTVKFNKEVLDSNGVINGTINGVINELSSTELVVFNQIKLNNRIIAREISEINNVPLRTVQRAISKLKELKFIERVGSNKTGYWKILK